MNRRLLTLALAGMTGATMIVPALASAATSVAYDSTPAPGVVSVPSVGAESYSFNHIGNEVILRPHHGAIRNVSVTMESLACQHGGWSSGCTTTPGARFHEPITLTLYRAAKANATTHEIKPGRQIMHVTKTFAIRYRPSSASAGESRYLGSDGQYHNGIAQTITFPVNRKLGNDVVWAVDQLQHEYQRPAADRRRRSCRLAERRPGAGRPDRPRPLPKQPVLGYPLPRVHRWRAVRDRPAQSGRRQLDEARASSPRRGSPFARPKTKRRASGRPPGWHPALMSHAAGVRVMRLADRTPLQTGTFRR